jgi:predicted nucleic acid-binding protein
MIEKIYFDTCALNRLNDDRTDARVREEADSVLRLLDLVATRRVHWWTSTAVRVELSRNPDIIRRIDALAVLEFADEFLEPSATSRLRAVELEQLGYRGLDGLHVALAEQAQADWLVTTDDRFLRLGERNVGFPKTVVINPVELLKRRFPWPLSQNP